MKTSNSKPGKLLSKSLLQPARLALLALIVFSVFLPTFAEAKNKVDLEDVAIKGELQNDNRLRILSRERNQLKNYVKYRTNYRPEVLEDQPRPASAARYSF